ncbi:hypothetical protein H5410_054412 [Solanum commersonii]|uniref:NB-ARC domain-containing protein n=1 Tax=Solanum commersonii TaxID=4109 RepID=A0A9J5WHF7_SOLCO|nr:hypothetical protein H5410_054412 [Solanum commersonii]
MNLESADMVGREEVVKLLEGRLLAKGEERPDIITISGEAGIGKITVAEAVYEKGQKDFDCHAWVFVSKNDSTRRVMLNILKGILKSISVMAPYNIDTMGEKPLKKLINIWLIGKKFLLILDDIPSWEIVEVVNNVIPRGREKTRILVTSRVSNELNECKLRKLNSVDSYHLLHKHACTSERGNEFFSSVDSVAKEIVRLSCGLPLTIVTVGRMLSTKHTAEDWIKVHQMFLRGTSFMSLCYADLRPELQSCFLYAASFPIHFEISCKKMKHLWIAEDFVQHEDNRTLEESAQDQPDELIHRNMIQVVKRNIDGRVKTCRILRRMRKSYSADMGGREEVVKLLEGWLLAKEEECPDIITISGEAGIGKTTVAEAVYDQGKKDFDCHAWVFVSKNDSTRRVMQNILKGILKSISVMAPYNIDTMGEKPLKKLINIWLIGKKFLLILDDIPSWEIVEVVNNVIPRGREKTRILVTSRVSNELNECKLRKLNPVDSYHLLHKHARTSERGDEFFSSVDSVAKEIVRLSCGLPLTIVTVGRMLSTKHTAEDWIKVHQMFLRGASFMSLCYADLSPELQSCFLYAASFPIHFEISCKKMKRLWIAEDFVQHEANRTLEESAQDQLDELIHRNMIQVVKRNIDGRVKTCRILRRMRKFALRRSEGDHFTVILPNLKRAFPERCHRAFLYGASYDGTSTSKFSRKDFSGLYSFLALELNQHQAPLNLNDFRLLCVLELQGFCHESLPDAIGDLSLLRYLGLRSGKIKKLPVSLKKLKRLQTLDIRDTFIRDLPDDLEGWQKLRHLLLEGSFTDKVVNLRDGIIEAFVDLQTLAGLKMTEAIAKGLINLRGIRKLSIGAVQGLHLLPLFKAVERMEFLRSFTMKGSFEDESYKFPFPQLYSLEKLCIGGPMMNNLLDWVGKLHYVKSLYLWDSKLTKDPLRSLQHLSNLMVLSICNSYDGKNIEFGHEGFPKLKKLSILHCQNLKSWEEIPHGAMTKLESLNFGYCPSLVELPKGLEKLNSLCSIEVSNMSSQFMQYVHELQSISRLSISIRGTVQ